MNENCKLPEAVAQRASMLVVLPNTRLRGIPIVFIGKERLVELESGWTPLTVELEAIIGKCDACVHSYVCRHYQKPRVWSAQGAYCPDGPCQLGNFWKPREGLLK